MAKKTVEKPSNEAIVEEYMDKLQHPLKDEINALRTIIRKANPAIRERIKWNAPSYYLPKDDKRSKEEDLVTFNHRATEHVHLVFHHPEIVHLKSPLLEGEYENRRMAYFPDMADITKKKRGLQTILNNLIERIEK